MVSGGTSGGQAFSKGQEVNPYSLFRDPKADLFHFHESRLCSRMRQWDFISNSFPTHSSAPSPMLPALLLLLCSLLPLLPSLLLSLFPPPGCFLYTPWLGYGCGQQCSAPLAQQRWKAAFSLESCIVLHLCVFHSHCVVLHQVKTELFYPWGQRTNCCRGGGISMEP